MSHSILLEEMEFKNKIKNLIEEKFFSHKLSSLKERIAFRNFVRDILIKEGEAMADKVPHKSTAINLLEELLKKIIPIIEKDYKSLTSAKEQRHSFREHILNAVKEAMTTTEVNLADTGAISTNAQKEPQDLSTDPIDEDIDVGMDDGLMQSSEPSVQSDNPDDKYIDIGMFDDGDAEKDPADEFGTSLSDKNLDTTGRNMAYTCFTKINQSILDDYEILSNDDDRQTFIDYLLTNLMLYMDKFEDELMVNIPDPVTTQQYQDTKTNEPQF